MDNMTHTVTTLGSHSFGYSVATVEPTRWYSRWWTVGALAGLSAVCALIGA